MTQFLCFLIYSFIGWFYETVLCSVRERRFVKRGFLNGPYCPIYGSGAMLVVYALEPFSNPILIFIFSMILCSVLEYFTSWVLEKAFHARWWDYSRMKFNLRGRICLLGALVFGGMCLFTVKFLHPLVLALVGLLSPLVRDLLGSVLAAGFVADFVVTVVGLSSLNARLREFSALMKAELEDAGASLNEKLNEKLGEHWKERRENFGEKLSAMQEKWDDIKAARAEKAKARAAAYREFFAKLGFQQRRTLRNFPAFKSMKYGEAVTHLRAMLAERRMKSKETHSDNTHNDASN